MQIRNDGDLTIALAEVGRLMDSNSDLPDNLITAIEAYEAEHYPIPPPSPEEAIAFRREQESA